MACGCVSAADALSVRALRMASSGSLLVRRYTPGYVFSSHEVTAGAIHGQTILLVL